MVYFLPYKLRLHYIIILRKNKWKKQGIAIVPVSFEIGQKVAHLNQAGALVHVYTDGSVLLSHGAIELGQVHYIVWPTLIHKEGCEY